MHLIERFTASGEFPESVAHHNLDPHSKKTKKPHQKERSGHSPPIKLGEIKSVLKKNSKFQDLVKFSMVAA